VDKLEERLAGFALGRRDIDNRERKCAEIEEKAQYMDKECIALREQITDNDEEHEELKALLEGMATDRTTLQGQIAKLTAEKERANNEVTNLLGSIESLQGQIGSLHHEQQHQQLMQQQQQQQQTSEQDWAARVQEYENRLVAVLEENARLVENTSNSRAVIADLRRKVDDMILSQQELEILLQQAQSTKASLGEKLNEAIGAQRATDARLQQEMDLHKAQLAEAEAWAEALRGEQNLSLESSLADEKSSLETELAQVKQQAEKGLKEECEMFEVRLAEEKTSLETQLAELKQQVGNLLKEEYVKYETQLAEEKQRAKILLEEGQQKVVEQLKLQLEAEKEKFEIQLAEERQRAETIVKEEQHKSAENLMLQLEEERRKFETQLAEEKQRAETILINEQQRLAEQLRLQLEKISEDAKVKDAPELPEEVEPSHTSEPPLPLPSDDDRVPASAQPEEQSKLKEEEVIVLQEEIEILNREQEEHKECVMSLEQELVNAQAKSTLFEEDFRKLQKELDAAKTSCQKAEVNRDVTQERLDILTELYEDRLSTAQKENIQKAEEVNSLQGQVQILTQEKEAHTERITSLEQNLATAQAKAERFEKDYLDVQWKIVELKQQNETPLSMAQEESVLAQVRVSELNLQLDDLTGKEQE
jgi:hypothetical protein